MKRDSAQWQGFLEQMREMDAIWLRYANGPDRRTGWFWSIARFFGVIA
jgi:hypothetical protein